VKVVVVAAAVVVVANHHAVKVAAHLHLGSAVIAIMRHYATFAALDMAA
jgi:hypothetical protein